MPAPYSSDLRERVVRAYLGGGKTYAEVASRFDVGEATVRRWVSRWRRTDSCSPDAMGGDRHSKFDAESEGLLARLVFEAPDITREELVEALEKELGLMVSTSAVQRALERLNLTRRSRPPTPRKETPTAS